jgi:hypothetical protein
LNPHCEGRQTSTDSARSPGNTAVPSIVADASDPTLEAETQRPKPERSDPDGALRAAIAAAVDARDFDRVRALVAVLESSPKPAAVLSLASRKALR